MQGALAEASQWITALATGPFATGLAMLAVTGVGITTLTGTLPRAQMLRVLLGLALLFAAPLIARQLLLGSGDRSPWLDQHAVMLETGEPLAAPHPICWTCR
jgi:type IV secretory pathway VirB2 component (pilin)